MNPRGFLASVHRDRPTLVHAIPVQRRDPPPGGPVSVCGRRVTNFALDVDSAVFNPKHPQACGDCVDYVDYVTVIMGRRRLVAP